MRCIGLYLKIFTQMLSSFYFEATLTGVTKFYGSDGYSYLSSRVLPLPFPPCWMCFLHSSAVSGRKLVLDYFFRRRKKGHREHFPKHENQLVPCEKMVRQLRYCKDKILLPHSEVEMLKWRISRARCSCLLPFQCKPWGLYLDEKFDRWVQ